MRAIVVSDSHTDTSSLERAIDSQGKLDLIIHLGDVARDVDYIETSYYPVKVVSVLGNNDYRYDDYEKVIDFDGHKLFICHGHTQSVSSGYERIEATARSKGCEAALFGHTHRSVLERREDGFLLINPGSVSKPRGCKPSFAVLETEKNKLKAVIVDWVL